MPATVLCARANAQINHGSHKYGANQPWWCPGFDQVLNTVTVVGSKPDELPVEHEVFAGGVYKIDHDFAWYDLVSKQFRQIDISDTVIQHAGRLVVRYDKVARYEAPAPEVKEPTGLGAVVTDRLENPWVRMRDGLWHGPADTPYHWDHIPRPVVVHQPGVELW